MPVLSAILALSFDPEILLQMGSVAAVAPLVRLGSRLGLLPGERDLVDVSLAPGVVSQATAGRIV